MNISNPNNESPETLENTGVSEPKEENLDSSTLSEDEEKIKREKQDFAKLIMRRNRPFEQDFCLLHTEEPFLGMISMRLAKRIDNKCPTAYVGIDKNTHEIVMGYNEEFFNSLTQVQRKAVIKHELYHVIFKHLTDRMPLEKNMQMVANVAMDLAINSIIGADNLPSLAMVPGRVPEPRPEASSFDKRFNNFIKNVPPMQSTDFYYESLKDLINDAKEKGEFDESDFGRMTTLDVHDWERLPSDIQDILKEKIKGMMEKAARNADQNNQWGSVPLDVQVAIRKMISREVDWRSVLRNFIGRARSQERYSSMKKINKKMPYVYPGARRHTTANFACFIDQSGSVGDDDLGIFFGELESLSNFTTMDVFHFDTEIDEKNSYIWKKGQKKQPKRTKQGGTDFDAVQRFLNRPDNKGKYTAAIILSDMFAPKMGLVLNTKIMYIVTPNGDATNVRPGDLVVKMTRDGAKKNAKKG